MKITALRVTDFKKIRTIEINPDASRALVLIGGRNAQGKSSILDAITAVLGGGRALPADPVRHGADESTILVEFDGGALAVRRQIKADGATVIEVRENGVALRSPQKMLDALVGARFLDPLAFLALDPPKQRAALLAVIDADGQIAKIDAQRQKSFDLRTDIGRRLKDAKGALERMPKLTALAEVDVSALSDEVSRLQDGIARGRRYNDRLSFAHAKVAQCRDAVAKAQADLEAAQSELVIVEADEEPADDAPEDVDHVLADLKAKIASASVTNREASARAADMRQRDRAEVDAKKLEKEHDAAAREIDAIDKAKASHLEAAALPVPGLGFSDGAVTLAGVPLSQASGAERIQVAIALAAAASPKLDDIWVRDGSLMDDDHLAAAAASAKKLGKVLWVEVVNTRGDDTIVIEDGKIR